MNELDFLKTLMKLEVDRDDLSIQYSIEDNIFRKSELKAALLKIEDQIGEIEGRLIEIDDKTFSQRARKAMISQLETYVLEMSKAKEGLRVDRNQRLILKNYLFSMIIRDMEHLIQDEPLGHHSPNNLVYTYRIENSVHISELSEFLNSEIGVLRETDKINYVVLRNYFQGFKTRIIASFTN